MHRTLGMATAASCVKENLRAIRESVAAAVAASKRPENSVTLVAVSKTKPREDIMAAYEEGQRHFGENYVQELLEKAPLLPQDIRWHYIGSIQSNKLKAIASVPNVWVVETIESVKQAKILDKACQGRDSPLAIYLQVNTSGEESKSGLQPESAAAVAKEIVDSCPSLQLAGLMTIGSAAASRSDGLNPDFETLNNVKTMVEHACNVQDLALSMGMSDDFVQSIAQGSTSKIFGGRNYAK
ncbi:hypothetical protein HDV03_002782 [Kappamyces sp. JEL0829]|nr:hypothetical protein HDV03_002782 [Kappamyces sp. JEL0829]